VVGQGQCDGSWCNDPMMVQPWETLLLLADGVLWGERVVLQRQIENILYLNVE
jgi:hypothetical protein